MAHEKNKKIYIETYGCQMNFSDSEIVGSVMAEQNYQPTENIGEADIILLNTCSIRENAEQRIHKRLRELAALKKKNREVKIGVIGCMA
ncbi:MAG: tRNA (N6-isopentenyl adenosine(37)-C2)-methylthiotransferase MiaB, partial [Bacteroidales bacterium]|nr:tRNA (N6-isopentenyl adenosine(37)-C2)-methylthiotransferase MiaB [Bacteroidales bacterium]